MKTSLNSCVFTFLLFILPPLVSSAQRRTIAASSECRGVISVDFGAHRAFVDGPFGGHFGLNIENIVSEKLSFGLCVKDFVNQFSGFTLEKGLVEHRIVFQPSLSFYPLYALHGFYVNAGCGVFVYLDNSKNNSTVSDVSFFRLFPDVKLGFQSIEADKLAWNLYIASGLFIPKKAYNTIPVFEVGMKIGLKL